MRRFEGGRRSSSRYFATVRRASGRPSAPSTSAIRESESGRAASSYSISFLMRFLIDTELTASPMVEVIPLWKKKRIS